MILDYEQKYKEALERARDMMSYKEVRREDMEYLFPELKESKDEKIRKQIISFLKEFECDHYRSLDFSSWITWLEKQGEQKPTNIDFKAKDCYVSNVDGKIHIVGKFEPKFKVGYWVVNKFGDSWHIDSFDKQNYQVSDGKGNYNYFSILHQDDMRLWTIEDAKDGDVLAGKIDGDSYILIYKQIKDGWIETYGHYYDSVNRFCVPSQLFCREVKGTFYPATKEQRDLLFQKMKKDGYEWDADEKVLNKVIIYEQK